MFSVSQFFRACFIRLGLSAEKLAKVDFGRRLIFTDPFVTQARGAAILTFNAKYGSCFKGCTAIISIAIIIGGRRRWAGFLESEVSQSFPCLQTWYLSLWKLPYFSSSSTSDHNSKMIGALLLHIYMCASFKLDDNRDRFQMHSFRGRWCPELRPDLNSGKIGES